MVIIVFFIINLIIKMDSFLLCIMVFDFKIPILLININIKYNLLTSLICNYNKYV